MEKLTWEFDGRCPKCGSEDITEVFEDNNIYICDECRHKFMVIIDVNEAIFY